MSYLLASGCSWTVKDFNSEAGADVDCSFPKWPELLGKQLGIPKVVNVGNNGSSNASIFDRCYNEIINDKPKLCCISLSGWDRRKMFNNNFNIFTNLKTYELHKKNKLSGDRYDFTEYYENNQSEITYAKFLWENRINVASIMDDTLRDMFLFQSFCEQHKIDYLIIQSLQPIWKFWRDPQGFIISKSSPSFTENKRTDYMDLYNISNYIKHFLNSPYTSKLNESNLLGWPFFWEIGGLSVHDIFENEGYDKFKLHPNDPHPNALGHQKIANLFYRGYMDVYGKIL